MKVKLLLITICTPIVVKKDFEICCVPSDAEFRRLNLYLFIFMLFDLVFLLNSMR